MGTATRRPGRPSGAESGRTRERVLDAARDLFSARGYDAVGMRDIASAVGVDVATVHHHARSKAELREAVFARMYAEEREVLAAAADDARERLERSPGDVGGALHGLLDAYLDFLDTHPEVTFLWLRRWLEPREHGGLDAEYSLPLYDLVEGLLVDADRRGLIHEPQPRQAVRSIVWAVHGHVTALAGAAPTAAAGDREWASFRAFMHRLVDSLWQAP